MYKHKLRTVRESRNMTQRDLSVAADICPSTIFRIEAGDTTFKVNKGTAKDLAVALGVDVMDLFDPLELSHLGRPPHTGKLLVVVPDHVEDTCPDCFLVLPATRVCDNCGTTVAKAG